MPQSEPTAASLRYEVSGSGPGLIVFLHGALTGSAAFAAPVAALAASHMCITVDFPGHGASPARAAALDFDSLSMEVAALIEGLGGAAHLVGLCIGGVVAMRVALRRPDLVRSLVLIGTSAEPEPAENMAKYRLAGLVGRYVGVRPLLHWVMPVLFGLSFLADPARAAERDAWRQALAKLDGAGARRTLAGIVERGSLDESLHRIRAPALVIVGTEDTATIPLRSERICARIRGSRLVTIPGAGHTAPVEQPAAVVDAIGRFLAAYG